MTATDLVAWYNGHPDRARLDPPLQGRRAVVVGNGNVALDVARILATDPARLAGTDIADHALAALRGAELHEVVVLGRRGPAEAAFTMPELVGLLQRPDLDVAVEGVDLGALPDHPKVRALREGAVGHRDPERRTIVLRFMTAPLEILGDDHVTGLRVTRTALRDDGSGRPVAEPVGPVEDLEASVVLRSVGYRSTPIDGVPFDDERHRVPHVDGRVLDRVGGDVVPGVYVVGWAKRGPTGFIGTNKSCSLETVNALLADANARRLPTPTATSRDLDRLLLGRTGRLLDRASWRTLDAHERGLGLAQGRPRVKLVDVDEMTRVSDAGPSRRPARRRRPRRSSRPSSDAVGPVAAE